MISILCSSAHLLCVLIIIGQLARTLDTLQLHSDTDQSNSKRHCDGDFCDDVVTKCMSNGRCSCDFEQVACRKLCIDCLEEKFGKCCGCVDNLCPVVKDEGHSSHVGDLPESSYDELFDVLTETDDIHGRWTVANGSSYRLVEHPEWGQLRVGLDEGNKRLIMNSVSHENQLGLNYGGPDEGYLAEAKAEEAVANDDEEDGTSMKRQPIKCVVAFINKQLGMSQCKRYCRSMGASSFRWFHEGCCECVGKSCIHYGLSRPQCSIDLAELSQN
jgi:hypothetical protein